jgi:hypothetical protein
MFGDFKQSKAVTVDTQIWNVSTAAQEVSILSITSINKPFMSKLDVLIAKITAIKCNTDSFIFFPR